VVKCPACGFESPDEAQWCDFCKEPFRKARPATPPAKVDSEAVRKALDPTDGIPPEFLALDSGGKIPPVPPWLRYATWSVIAAWFIAIMAFMGAYLAKRNSPSQTQARQSLPAR
jgi:hypothetical protein